MKYGFVLPYGDAHTAAELAHEAEAAGWDGFFVWEPGSGCVATNEINAACVAVRWIVAYGDWREWSGTASDP